LSQVCQLFCHENAFPIVPPSPRFQSGSLKGIILISNPGAELATPACLAARVAANCEAERYGEV
jgi:hypothetical protein